MQIIKYKWENWIPQLVIRNNKSIEKIPLLDNELNVKIGEKKCIGFSKDGKAFDCKNQRKTEDKQCNECKLEDDYYFCIKCDGSQCINTKKRDECKDNFYYVYLAAFDAILKVGISYEYRIMERLVEQGADFGAKIARIQDGKIVREIEQKIRKEINITDRVSGIQKQNSLFCNPNVAVSNIFKAISTLKENGISKYLIGPEIYDLRHYYKLNNVFSLPKQEKINDNFTLEGRVTAAKGNVIIIQKNRTFFSINAHDLIGREILI